jgi:GcrA cell cycle regulator
MIGQVWDAAADARLIELWALGLSAGKIGLDMGRSKNSVVGRVHRLNLPGRASPIEPGGAPRQVGAKAATLALPREGYAQMGRRGSAAMAGPSLVLLGAVAAADAEPVRDAPVVAARLGSHACTWPIGEPRTKEFRYCDAPAVLGRSYCPVHHAMAVQPKVQRSAANIAADAARRAAAHGRMALGGGFANESFEPGWAR